ncbi:MAG: 30S ribosomal protein S8 [Candidatus Paceibacterota bacterium]
MYIDLLTKIKNAQAVKKEIAKSAFSKMDEQVLEILLAKGYISGFEKKGKGAKRVFDIQLKYDKDTNDGAIAGIKFISKPSRKMYIGYKEIRPIKSGYGLMVLSTPDGVLAGGEAKKKKIGGELLFEIW